MTFNEFLFVYNSLIKKSDSLINEFIIIFKLKINETNIISTDDNSNGKKIKTFFYIFYKMFLNFDEKEAKKILVKDIPNKEVIEFLNAIIIFFLNINVLNKSLNTKANQKYLYLTN